MDSFLEDGLASKDPLQVLCTKLNIPLERLAGVEFAILPDNFKTADSADDLFDTPDGIALAKALKAGGVACLTAADVGMLPKVRDRRAADVWLGTIYALGTDPVVAGVFANYIYDRFIRGASSGTKLHVKYVSVRGERTTELQFDGPPEEFAGVVQVLRGQSK